MVLLCCLPTAARAELSFKENWVSTGIDVGMRLRDRAGLLLGGELSYVMMNDNALWSGGYASGAWQAADGSVRLSMGGEVGWAFFGFDFGPALELGSGRARLGFQIRGLLSVGFVGLYGGYARFFGREPDLGSGIFGVLVKLPLSPREVQSKFATKPTPANSSSASPQPRSANKPQAPPSSPTNEDPDWAQEKAQ